MYVSVRACRSKSHYTPMELELQVVVTDPLQVVETELRSSVRAVCVLTVEAFKQPSKELLKLKICVSDGEKSIAAYITR